MKLNNIFKFSLLMSFALLLAACTGNKSDDSAEFRKMEGLVWNTSYHVTYQSERPLDDSIICVLDRVGKNLSVFDPSSLVSKVNAQDSTPVNTDFIRVYIMSVKINKASDGAFDPTLSPAIDAWGFGKGHKVTADTARMDSIMQFIGISKTRLSHDALVKDDTRIRFNFSAIAKGYGCDAIAEMLRDNGVENFLVEIGGEIMARGKSPSGDKWRISVDRPILSADREIHESQSVIAFTDMGVATSGNYRNFHSENGEVFGHTISAATGRPARTDILSATVLAKTAMEADGLATAYMAMGSEKAIRLNKSMKLPAMFVLADSTVWMSPQFEKLIAE